MNEHEITEARSMAATLELANLYKGACVLANLRDWTNQNSDGWPYWAPPNRASQKLQAELARMRTDYFKWEGPKDITDSDLARLCTPIKSFLTRRGVDHGLIFKP